MRLWNFSGALLGGKTSLNRFAGDGIIKNVKEITCSGLPTSLAVNILGLVSLKNTQSNKQWCCNQFFIPDILTSRLIIFFPNYYFPSFYSHLISAPFSRLFFYSCLPSSFYFCSLPQLFFCLFISLKFFIISFPVFPIIKVELM